MVSASADAVHDPSTAGRLSCNVAGVRGRLFAGMTMALRRPHERTKMARRRVAQTRANLRCAVSGGQDPALQSPLPTPLDSGLRRNDEWGAGLTKGCREWRMRGWRSGLFS